MVAYESDDPIFIQVHLQTPSGGSVIGLINLSQISSIVPDLDDHTTHISFVTGLTMKSMEEFDVIKAKLRVRE